MTSHSDQNGLESDPSVKPKQTEKSDDNFSQVMAENQSRVINEVNETLQEQDQPS